MTIRGDLSAGKWVWFDIKNRVKLRGSAGQFERHQHKKDKDRRQSADAEVIAHGHVSLALGDVSSKAKTEYGTEEVPSRPVMTTDRIQKREGTVRVGANLVGARGIEPKRLRFTMSGLITGSIDGN